MGKINLEVEFLRVTAQGFKDYVKWLEQDRISPVQQKLIRLGTQQVYPDDRDNYERYVTRNAQELATLVSIKSEMEQFAKLLSVQADELEQESNQS